MPGNYSDFGYNPLGRGNRSLTINSSNIETDRNKDVTDKARALANAAAIAEPLSEDLDIPDPTKAGGESPPQIMRATEIAGRAADLVGGDRDRQHGAKKDNFARIATMWNAWLQTRKCPAEPLSAFDVGILMVLMKTARTQSGALNVDDFVDGAGYMACAGEIAQLDLTDR